MSSKKSISAFGMNLYAGEKGGFIRTTAREGRIFCPHAGRTKDPRKVTHDVPHYLYPRF